MVTSEVGAAYWGQVSSKAKRRWWWRWWLWRRRRWEIC